MRRILIVVTLGLVSVWPTLAYTNIDTNTADGHAKYIDSEVESRFAQATEATPTETLFWQSIQNSDDRMTSMLICNIIQTERSQALPESG